MSDKGEKLYALPGWVVVEDLGQPQTITKSGLQVMDDMYRKAVHLGKVLSCGEHVDKVSGIETRGRNWIEPGELVFFLATNPWPLPGIQDITVRAVRSTEVICEAHGIEFVMENAPGPRLSILAGLEVAGFNDR